MKNLKRQPSFILTDADVSALTKREHADAQCRALRSMGIKFGQRLDGSPVVTRDAVRAYTGEEHAANEPAATLNLRAIHESKAKAR